jgi:ketol-acid reductoisomerase
VNENTRKEMRRILDEIQSGRFAREWILETKAGKPVFNALTRAGEEHPLEEVGRRLRALMPWLAQNKLVDKTKN